MGGGRHPCLGHQLLGEELRALEPGGLGAGAEGGDPGLLERVDDPLDQRRLGPDDDEVGLLLARRRDDAFGVLGGDLEAAGVGRDPGIARSAQHLARLRRARERAHDRVLASPAADDQDLQTLLLVVGSLGYRALARSSAGIAASVWLLIVPREPSSTETLAIVVSSGPRRR